MIIGVTHDQDDRVVQRLSVSTKVSIGLPTAGQRLPHPHLLLPIHSPDSLCLAGDPDFHGWPFGREHR